MKSYQVVFAPEAEDQLVTLYKYIAGKASPQIAKDYLDAIVEYCAGMQTFPHRGRRRDDVRPGLRVTNYRGNAVIAFMVDDTTMLVTIIDVFYDGQDYETTLGHADKD